MSLECSCAIESPCYDGPEFYSETNPRAKKDHTCGECMRIIKSGEIYERAVGVWDGEWGTHKTCMGCKRMRDEMICGGFIYGQVAEDIAEVLGMSIDEVI